MQWLSGSWTRVRCNLWHLLPTFLSYAKQKTEATNLLLHKSARLGTHNCCIKIAFHLPQNEAIVGQQWHVACRSMQQVALLCSRRRRRRRRCDADVKLRMCGASFVLPAFLPLSGQKGTGTGSRRSCLTCHTAIGTHTHTHTAKYVITLEASAEPTALAELAERCQFSIRSPDPLLLPCSHPNALTDFFGPTLELLLATWFIVMPLLFIWIYYASFFVVFVVEILILSLLALMDLCQSYWQIAKPVCQPACLSVICLWPLLFSICNCQWTNKRLGQQTGLG